MIASLTGILTSIGKSEIIIEVNGVGYLLNVTSKLISTLGEIGSTLSVFTDLQIKDDKILMYGFITLADQDFFRLLQTVQGIGPKAALSILSALTINELILAISSGDKAMISRAEGVGPKVAARVVSELSEKVTNMQLILGKKDINLHDLNLLVNEEEFKNDIFVKVRSTGKLLKGKVNFNKDRTALVNLEEFEDGISPGQACVFYNKDKFGLKVLGGGWIKS